LNAIVGRREMVTSEVTVSAKDKKKSKTDRDKRSEVRTNSDKDKEALEWAIKKSQEEEKRKAKVKAKEDKEMAKVLEQSRLEAEIAAKELQSLSCTPANTLPFSPLGRGILLCVMCMVTCIPLLLPQSLPSQRLSFLPDSEKIRAMFPPPKHRHFLSRPPDRPSESKDSRVPDALKKKSSECALTRESKNSFVNSESVESESLLPTSEAKTDTESDINLFAFPEVGGMTVGATSGHSSLPPPARMNSSSSDLENQDVKQEPLEGPNAPLDLNDEFDLRNGILKSGDSPNYLPSSSESETPANLPERQIITEEDVQLLKQKADCWNSAEDVLDMMERRGGKDTRPNIVVSKKALANVLFHSRPVAFDMDAYIKAYLDSYEIGRRELELRLVALEADERAKVSAVSMELEQLKQDYEVKLRDLNFRIQASEALEEDTKDASKQLDDALSKNVRLEEKVRKLEEILKGVRNGSNILSVPPPAVVRVRHSDPSREFSSSVSSVVDGRDNRKRDLDPSIPSHHAPPKKIRSEAWNKWNRDGSKVATGWVLGVARTILHDKSAADLHALVA
jgi:hypothetical protein